MFAKVALNIPGSQNELYTYLIKEDEPVFIGARCLVDFGFQKALGYVIEIVEESDYVGRVKEIDSVLDKVEEINDEQMLLAKEIAKSNKVSLAKTLDLMLPSVLKSKYRRFLYILDINKIDANLVMLFGGKKKVLITESIKKEFPKIRKEIEQGNIEIGYDLYQYGKNKKEKVYTLNKTDFSDISKMRYDVLKFVEANEKVNKDTIIENTGCSEWLIKSLEDKEYLKSSLEAKKNISKDKEIKKSKTNYSFIQSSLVGTFQKVETEKPFLLFTNDEKFKKMFLLDESFNVLNKGKKVLIVVPSIVACLEVTRFFKSNLKGCDIYSFSSVTSNSEFYDNYYEVKSEKPAIVITTKIGIFLPLNNIGLITLIDEENINYSVEENGKYQVLDVLEYRANYHKARMILTSMAPSIVSYYNASHGKYILLPYNVDFKGKLEKVDMHYEIENVMMSEVLRKRITQCLESKKIAMLILDNKAYSTTLVCLNCGNTLKCPHCEVNLIYSEDKHQATCPYCSYKTEDLECHKCHSNEFNKLGFGLEKLKESLLSLFPEARVIQIDSDLTLKSGKYEEALLKIEDNDVDIIVGTSVALEIKNQNINLIGLIKGDNLLAINDYRASELSYQMICYCMNRENILTVVQGSYLDHYVLDYALKNDYRNFYDEEIKKREAFKYPPYAIISRIRITGEFKSMYHAANYFKMVFSRLKLGDALGPVYSKKIKGLYVTIKYKDFTTVNKLIDEVDKKFKDEKVNIGFDRVPSLR